MWSLLGMGTVPHQHGRRYQRMMDYPKRFLGCSSQRGIVAGEWGWGQRDTHKREVYIQKKSVEAGEIVQWLRTLSAFPEDLDSNPNSFLVAGYLSSVTLVP